MATQAPATESAGEVRAFIGLGANLGDAKATLLRAVQAIADLPATRLLKRSSLFRSSPVDADGPDFLNAVVEVGTRLSPADLLAQLQAIEVREGRQRPYRHAPRTLDLDLLLHGNAMQACDALTLPHPRMWERAFVLRPLAQIAPDLVTAQQLERVRDQSVTPLPDT